MCNVSITKFVTGSLPCGDGTCITADLFCNGVPNCNSSTTIFTDEICDFDNLRCPQTQFMVTLYLIIHINNLNFSRFLFTPVFLFNLSTFQGLNVMGSSDQTVMLIIRELYFDKTQISVRYRHVYTKRLAV